MIRINLLGRARPKAARKAVPLGAMLQLVFLALAIFGSLAVLYGHYVLMSRQNAQVSAQIQTQLGEKARLEQLKQQVDTFEKQKAVLQQRIGVIEELQRNRTGGQELLNAIASTVSRTNTLWLTDITRKGNELTINGSAGSINAVANYITQLKRSGYFQTVEIKESHQDQSEKAVQVFEFSLSAQFALPQPPGAGPGAGTQPAATGAPAPSKGRAGKS